MLYEIRSAIFIIPLVSVLANVSIAKTYGKRNVVCLLLLLLIIETVDEWVGGGEVE